MARKLNVFVKEKFFVILDDVTSGRITGEKQDTITVFFKGGGSAYFYVGEEAEDFLGELVDQLQSIITYCEDDMEIR